MNEGHTTAAVEHFLRDLGEGSPSEPIVRALLERAVGRLQILCATMLVRSYPRLMRPPLGLDSQEMLSAVVGRLIKAMREVHPQNARQFFGLATRHMRWELNDLARRLDEHSHAMSIRDDLIPSPESTGSVISPNARRMLGAIEALPEPEREVFDLVRIQGLTHTETAELIGVSTKTVQRRLNRGLLLLAEQLEDLRPAEALTSDGGAR